MAVTAFTLLPKMIGYTDRRMRYEKQRASLVYRLCICLELASLIISVPWWKVARTHQPRSVSHPPLPRQSAPEPGLEPASHSEVGTTAGCPLCWAVCVCGGEGSLSLGLAKQMCGNAAFGGSSQTVPRISPGPGGGISSRIQSLHDKPYCPVACRQGKGG